MPCLWASQLLRKDSLQVGFGAIYEFHYLNYLLHRQTQNSWPNPRVLMMSLFYLVPYRVTQKLLASQHAVLYLEGTMNRTAEFRPAGWGSGRCSFLIAGLITLHPFFLLCQVFLLEDTRSQSLGSLFSLSPFSLDQAEHFALFAVGMFPFSSLFLGLWGHRVPPEDIFDSQDQRCGFIFV